jgi:hypothetical protein
MRKHSVLIKSNIKKGTEFQSINSTQDAKGKISIEEKIPDSKPEISPTGPEGSRASDIFAFLYKGYNEKHYYWEVIIFLKKLSLTFIAIFTELFPTHSKSVLLLIVLIFFIYLNLRSKPYVSMFLNYFDTFSLIVSFITANVGILLWSKDLQPASPFFLGVIILANFGFFFSWIYFFGLKSFGPNFWKLTYRTCLTKPWHIFSVIRKAESVHSPRKRRKTDPKTKE